MKIFVFFFLVTILPFKLFAIDLSLLFNKKWVIEKSQESNGKVSLATMEELKQYEVFYDDGTFESVEDHGLIKGVWQLDAKTNIITENQDASKYYPPTISFKIADLTVNKLVIEVQGAGNDKLTIYLKANGLLN